MCKSSPRQQCQQRYQSCLPSCTQEFSFKVQVPGGGGGKDDMITIGKAEIDMADYVDDQLCVQV